MKPMISLRSARTTALAVALLALGGVAAPILADDGCLGDNPLSDQGILELAPGVDINEILTDPFYVEREFTLRDSIPSRGIYLVSHNSLMTHDEFEMLFINDSRVDHSELNYDSGDPGGGTQSIFLFTAPGEFQNQPVITTLGLEGAQGVVTGAGVTIAVIDSGVDPTHGQIAGRLAPGGIAFLFNPDDASYDPDDWVDQCNGIDDDNDALLDEAVGHGTAVAALSLLVAPDAKVLPIRVLNDEGYTTAFRVAKAIYYAMDQGVEVVNLSLSTCADLRIIERAVDDAVRLGIIVVAAAGNHEMDSHDNPEFPAAMSKVAGVVATDLDGHVASFSNYGRDYIVAAPGVEIISAIPNEASCGPALPGSNYGEADGTSFAAPLVAGTAALLIEKGSVLRWNDFRDAMRETTTPIGAQNPDLSDPVGEGLLDVEAAVAWPGPCHADFSDDGRLDFTDVTLFLQGFVTGDDEADMAAPRGEHDFSDVVRFLEFFVAGCP
ncbi:MAG: S8 family serine peptidase [Phycisphaerales bacterium]